MTQPLLIETLNRIISLCKSDPDQNEPIKQIAINTILFEFAGHIYWAYTNNNGEIHALENIRSHYKETTHSRWITGILNGNVRDDEGNLRPKETADK